MAAVATVGSAASALGAANVWNGAGVGANTGNDWTVGSSYQGGTATFSSTADLDFSTISIAGPTSLSASTAGTYAMKDLLFGFGNTLATAETLTLSGTGTAGQTTLDLAGSISVPSTSSSKITLASDLTLNLSNAAHTVIFKANSNVTSNPTVLPILVVNSLITGGGTGAKFVNTYSAFGSASNTPQLVLTNNNNSFVAVENRFDGYVGYTSIADVGGGNSSLGSATTAATGTIYFGNGSNFNYIGTGNQSSNRDFVGGSGNTFGNASAGTTLNLSGNFTYASGANFGVALKANVISGATLIIGANITDSTYAQASNPKASINKQISQTYYTATGAAASNDGGGTLVLSGLSTYTGTVTVSAGVLEVTNIAPVNAANALGKSDASAANVVLGNGTTLRYRGPDATTDRLFTINSTSATLESSGTGAVSFTNAGAVAWGSANLARTLKLGGSSTGGNSLAAALSNNGTGVTSVVKQDAGTWALAGTSNYTGTTSVNGGTLLINGTHTGNGAYTIASGAVLGGSGSIGTVAGGSITVQGGGKLSPGGLFGSAPGTLRLSLGTGATLDISAALNGHDGALLFELGSVGSSDQVVLNSGALAIGSGQLNFADFVFTQRSGFPTAGGTYTYTLFDGGANISGTLASSGLSGALWSGGPTGELSTNGQDVLLTVTIPEPSTAGMLLGASAVTLLSKRRRVQA